MAAFEISIATLNHIANRRHVLLSNRRRWPAFVKMAKWTAQAVAFPRAAEDIRGRSFIFSTANYSGMPARRIPS
jgi:hypothetical protein